VLTNSANRSDCLSCFSALAEAPPHLSWNQSLGFRVVGGGVVFHGLFYKFNPDFWRDKSRDGQGTEAPRDKRDAWARYKAGAPPPTSSPCPDPQLRAEPARR
jgi:hypothetical protein